MVKETQKSVFRNKRTYNSMVLKTESRRKPVLLKLSDSTRVLTSKTSTIMKKTIFAVVCMAMMTMGCMANDNAPKAQKHGNAPRHEMVDPVINMEVVGTMGLSDKKVQQIAALQEKRQEEMRRLRAQHKPQGEAKAKRGKGHQPAAAPGKHQMAQRGLHRAEHHAQMKAMNDKYRKDLQDIMGTKTYVKYVEQVNDRLAMHKAGKASRRGHGQHRHNGHVQQQHGAHPQGRA